MKLKEDKLQTPEDQWSYSDTANVNDMLLHPNDAPDLPDEVENAITKASIYRFDDKVITPQSNNDYLNNKKSKRFLTQAQIEAPIIIGDETFDPDDSETSPNLSSRAEKKNRRKQKIQSNVIYNINKTSSVIEMDGPADSGFDAALANPSTIPGMGAITPWEINPAPIYKKKTKKYRRKRR